MFGPCLYSGRVAGWRPVLNSPDHDNERRKLSPASPHSGAAETEVNVKCPSPVLPEHLLPDDQSFADLNGILYAKERRVHFSPNLRALNAMVDQPRQAARAYSSSS